MDINIISFASIRGRFKEMDSRCACTTKYKSDALDAANDEEHNTHVYYIGGTDLFIIYRNLMIARHTMRTTMRTTKRINKNVFSEYLFLSQIHT